MKQDDLKLLKTACQQGNKGKYPNVPDHGRQAIKLSSTTPGTSKAIAREYLPGTSKWACGGKYFIAQSIRSIHELLQIVDKLSMKKPTTLRTAYHVSWHALFNCSSAGPSNMSLLRKRNGKQCEVLSICASY